MRKSARGLSKWNEHELALFVVKRDGTSAMGALAEHIRKINAITTLLEGKKATILLQLKHVLSPTFYVLSLKFSLLF